MLPLPQPLVPPDVDLRGLEYMPLFGNHLFGSEFNAAASDTEWRAALTLWWAAWNQVPAGSLPNDDVALCRLADLGRDVKGWRKLKTRALHGFAECSDGRLYHEFLCDQALVAWDKRIKERERKAKWRAEQEAKKAGREATVPTLATVLSLSPSASQNADVPAEGTGSEGKGRDETGRDDEEQEMAPDGAVGEADRRTPKLATIRVPRCPYDALIAVYHEVLPELPSVKLPDAKGRKKGMRELWEWVLTSTRADGSRRATTTEEGVVWFRGYCHRARDNGFVMGRTARDPAHENWEADIDYLCSSRGLKQVLEKTRAAA